MPDGSIVVSTELDNKKLERQLAKLEREIKKLEHTTVDQEAKKSPLIQQAQELEQSIRAARGEAKRYSEEWVSGVAGSDKNESAAIQRAVELEKQHEKVASQIDKIDRKLQPAYEKLEKMKTEAGALGKNLAAAGSGSKLMGDAVQKARKSVERFNMRLREVVRSALIFTLITQSFAKFRDWMGKVVQSNSEASAAVSQLKGALLTLAQPLVGVIIPAFTAFVNLLTRIVAALAQVMSVLFGSTISQSKEAAQALNEETEALNGTGAAAKKARSQLAGFDEINKLSEESAGGGGAASTSPSFDFDTNNLEVEFDKILNVVKLIGAALLTWKLSDGLVDGIVKFIGLFMTLDGAIGLAKATFDAWVNGVSWKNFMEMLGRAAELVAGLWLVAKKNGAAIGMIISGLTMLATAFHDVEVNGWNLQNMLLAVTGILAAGLGISLLVGSWIPMFLAAIAAALLAITVTFGDGEKLIEDAKKVLHGFLDFFVGVFTGDLDKALKGIGEIFDGLRGIVDNVLDAIRNMFFSFLDWLDEKTGGQLSATIQFIKDLVDGTVEWMKGSFRGFANAFQEILEGLITFLAGVFSGEWDKAWAGVTGIFKGFINLLISMVESFVNFFVKGINTIIGAANSLSFKAPDWLGGKTFGINIPKVPALKLPRLAAGAVIPPNREFMAVLGDQRQGNNIEAPEGLIRKIVREEAGGDDTTAALLQAILEAVRAGKVMVVDKKVLARVAAQGINDMTRAAGKPVLLF